MLILIVNVRDLKSIYTSYELKSESSSTLLLYNVNGL